MTGHPTASADIVSVPTTEMAKGKLQAPITTTGPRGRLLLCRPGFGMGIRSGSASFELDSRQSPERASLAKRRVSFTVRWSSILKRGRPNEVSPSAREMISLVLCSSRPEIVSKNIALRSPESFLKELKATVAASRPYSIDSEVESGKSSFTFIKALKFHALVNSGDFLYG